MTDRGKAARDLAKVVSKTLASDGTPVTVRKVTLNSVGEIAAPSSIGWTEIKHRLVLPEEGLALPSLADVARFVTLDEVTDSLPEAVSDFDGLRLTHVEIDDLDGDVTLDVTWAKARLPILPGVVEIDAPGLRFELDAFPPVDYANLNLFGTLKFGRATLFTVVDIPDLAVTATLTEPITLNDIAASLGIADNVFGDATIDRFSFTADPHYGHVSSSFVLDTTWEPAKGFALYRVAIDVDTLLGDHGGTTARVEANGLFAGLDLSLGGSYGGPDMGWALYAEAAHEHPVKVGKILQDALGASVEVPSVLSSLELHDLSVSYETRSKNMSFAGTATMAVSEGMTLDLVAEVTSTSRPDGTSDHSFSGAIDIADLHFGLGFAQAPDRALMVASYADPDGTKIGLREILGAVSDDLGNLIGDADPTITLHDALLVYSPGKKDEGAPSKYLFAMDVDLGLDLSGFGSLPLVGSAIPRDQMLKLSFQPLIASKDPAGLTDPSKSREFTEQELATIRSLIPDQGPVLPANATPGFTVVSTLQMGHYSRSITLGGQAKLAPRGANSLQQTSVPPQADPAAHTPRAAKPDKVTWIDLHKKLGPISLGRVGLGLADGRCLVRLDAALAMGPLTLSLEGLGADYDLSTHALDFDLDGIGLSFDQDAMSISGMFLKMDPGFAGMATLKLETLSIGAIGAYEEFHGDPSFFLYAFLDQPLGGPPFFFVEGLSVGFGYNRRFIAPPLDAVRAFPLVAEVMGDRAKAANGGAGLRDEMAALSQYLPPETDQYFLTVGVHFNSFKVLDGLALISATFGNSLEFDLMGEVTALVPPPPEPGMEPPAVLSKVIIAYLARYLPDEGFLGVTGKIAPGSFVFNPLCHMEGGFAFSSWFKGPHDGDFVFTMGGYHPDFKIPAHYPQPASVPRLTFRWEVDPHLSVYGDLYFALTSGAAMGGVEFHASWKSGALEAWFDLGIDVLIQWQPYHYTAQAHVEIGARVTIDPPIIGSISITIEAGAELELWGPEFSGRAHVHVSVMGVSVNFSVDFIETDEGEPKGISWEAFSKAFLPDAKSICSLAVADGMIRSGVVGSDGISRDVVNPAELMIHSSSVVPVSGLSESSEIPGATADPEGPNVYRPDLITDKRDFAGRYPDDPYYGVREPDDPYYMGREPGDPTPYPAGTYPDDPGYIEPNGDPGNGADAGGGRLGKKLPDLRRVDRFGVSPMHKPSAVVIATINVQNKNNENRTHDFDMVPILKRFPAALWGPTHAPEAMLSSESLVAVGGYQIVPSTPSEPGMSSRIERRHLDYDVVLHEVPKAPRPRQVVTPKTQETEGDADLLKVGEADPLKDAPLAAALVATAGKRDAALRALGMDPAAELDLSLDLVNAMTDDCQFVTMVQR